VTTGQGGPAVGELDVMAPVVFPGHELAHEIESAYQMLSRGRPIIPAIQWTTGNSLKEQNIARAADGEARHDEQLANAGNSIEPYRPHSGMFWPWRHAMYVNHGENTLGGGIGRTGGVTVEQLNQFSLAGGDDDKVIKIGQPIEIVCRDAVVHDL